jgi:hypothetical protein
MHIHANESVQAQWLLADCKDGRDRRGHAPRQQTTAQLQVRSGGAFCCMFDGNCVLADSSCTILHGAINVVESHTEHVLMHYLKQF